MHTRSCCNCRPTILLGMYTRLAQYRCHGYTLACTQNQCIVRGVHTLWRTWNISSHPSHCRPNLCHTGTCHCHRSCQHRHRYHARNTWFPNRYPGYGKHCTPVHNGSSHTCRNLFECPILVGTRMYWVGCTCRGRGNLHCNRVCIGQSRGWVIRWKYRRNFQHNNRSH